MSYAYSTEEALRSLLARDRQGEHMRRQQRGKDRRRKRRKSEYCFIGGGFFCIVLVSLSVWCPLVRRASGIVLLLVDVIDADRLAMTEGECCLGVIRASFAVDRHGVDERDGVRNLHGDIFIKRSC